MFATRVALGVACALAACSDDPTQLVLWVDTDYPAPLQSIHVIVTNSELVSIVDEQIPISRQDLPLSFGVVPGASYVDVEVLVTVAAVDENSEPVLRRRAVTGFERGERLLLPMFLAVACGGFDCGDDECTERGCEPLEIPSSDLKSISPGDELLHDAGASGRPATPDGGPPAHPDAGPDPCGCMSDQVCVHQTESRSCAPPDACTCAPACNPFRGGCTAPRVCTILDPGGPVAGACLENRGGRALGMSCTTEWSGDYQKTLDTCNVSNNLLCAGAYQGDPSSTCTIYCEVANPQCPNQQTCVPNVPPDAAIGTCLRAPLTHSDTGDLCTIDGGCQSGLCLFGRCATPCSGYASCSTDAACVTVGSSPRFCAQLCELDSECRGTLICETYGPHKVCVPFCSMSGWCPPGSACQPNGHCG